MKIGIIVYSQTGHTLSVAQKLKEKLLSAGHSASLEQVVSASEKPAVKGKAELKSIPDISEYDTLVFASPVQAFSLSSVMSAYLTQIPSLKGKKVACFVTQQLPRPWMGGNRAIAQMKAICKAKGIEVCETGIVNWGNKQREQMIEDVVKRFAAL